MATSLELWPSPAASVSIAKLQGRPHPSYVFVPAASDGTMHPTKLLAEHFNHRRPCRRNVITRASDSNEPLTSNSTKEDVDTDTPPPGCSRVKVELRKPLGLRLEENDSGNIFVVEVLKGGNADKSGVVDVGDQLVATSAVVYTEEEQYQGVYVRKGMQIVRLNVRGERFDTVVAAIGTHPAYIKVTLELQKCKQVPSNGSLKTFDES